MARARTEAVEPLLALAGALEGTSFQGDVLSYEVPTYFGMACVAYGPHGEVHGRPLLEESCGGVADLPRTNVCGGLEIGEEQGLR